MVLLLLCIFCNVLLAVIFKLFAHYKIDNLNAIVINYFVCVIASSVVIGELSIPLDFWNKSWFLLSVVLALLFITGFNVLALSFQKAGVALTVIIQKMSLVIPAAFAIAFFGESLPLLKLFGIICAILAIIFVNWPEKSDDLIEIPRAVIILPLLTFVMSGAIEIILYYVEASGKLNGEGIQFTATSFGMAGLMGAAYTIYRISTKKVKFNSKDFLGGIILGLPNYLTIYLLVALLVKGWQGSVLFPINNIGILIVASVVGVFLFREKLNKYKLIGLAMGAGAILLIGIS